MIGSHLFLSLASGLGIALLAFDAPNAAGAEEGMTQDELLRRTQELFDSVASGNKEPWKKYFAEDAIFFDDRRNNEDVVWRKTK